MLKKIFETLTARLLVAWLAGGLAALSPSMCNKAHAQYGVPFNATSVATLGGNCVQRGSIMFQSANSLSKCLGTGTSGQVLESGGPGADVQWLTVTGSGTVTSVALSSPASFFAVTGSPVTAAGTLTQTLTAAAQNSVWAGPGTGGTGTPSYRSLIVGDLPTGYPAANLAGTVSLTSQVTGTLPLTNGGTGLTSVGNFSVLATGSGTLTTAASPSAGGQLLLSQSSAMPVWHSASGDVSTISTAGAITVTKLNGVSPGTAYPLNVGVAANNIPQLNGTAQYPAADGSLITNVLHVTVDKRQTTLTAPANSSGQPNFLPATATGLTLTTTGVSSTAPLVMTCAQGYAATTGQSDLIQEYTSNISWTLGNNTTDYLGENCSTGAELVTTLRPGYQWAGPAPTTNGQYTYIISQGQMFLGNGSTASATPVMFAGEATTASGNITATVAYAIKGHNESAWTATLPAASAVVAFTHNLGEPYVENRLQFMNTVANCDANVNDIVEYMSSHISASNIIAQSVFTDMYTATVTAGATQAWLISDKANGGGCVPTAADWSYRMISDRIW